MKAIFGYLVTGFDPFGRQMIIIYSKTMVHYLRSVRDLNSVHGKFIQLNCR